MRTCIHCKQSFPENEEHFHFRNRLKGTYNGICKPCHYAYNRKHYLDNKDKYLKKAQRRRLEIRLWYKEFKSTLECKECGEKHPACLAFHHRDPKKKVEEISDLMKNGHKKKLLSEIKKCDVLCHNCHSKKHWVDIETFKKKYKEHIPGV